MSEGVFERVEDSFEDGQLMWTGDLDHDYGGERLVRRVGDDHVVPGSTQRSALGIDEVRSDEGICQLHEQDSFERLLVEKSASVYCIWGGMPRDKFF